MYERASRCIIMNTSYRCPSRVWEGNFEALLLSAFTLPVIYLSRSSISLALPDLSWEDLSLATARMIYQPRFAWTRIRLISMELGCPTRRLCTNFFSSTSAKLHGMMDTQVCPAEKTSIPWKNPRSGVGYHRAKLAFSVEKGLHPMLPPENWCIGNIFLFYMP